MGARIAKSTMVREQEEQLQAQGAEKFVLASVTGQLKRKLPWKS